MTRNGELRVIKNIVFDIGGVLADFRIKEFLLEKGVEAAFIKRILKDTASITSQIIQARRIMNAANPWHSCRTWTAALYHSKPV